MNRPSQPLPDDQQECLTIETIFQEYAVLLSRYIYSKVGQVALAEDLTSEVFLKALRWLEHGRSATSVRGWLYTTARTVIADHWRRTGVLATLPLDFAQAIAVDDLHVNANPSARQARQRVRRLLRQLPQRERQVLLLRYVWGYTATEIGQKLGLNPTYVRVVQFRALRQAALVEREEGSIVMDSPETESLETTYGERMRRVLAWAEEEACALNHHYIGTEHLLLGVLREGQSNATTVLTDMKVSVERVRGGVLMIVGKGEQPPSGALMLTERAKTALALGAEEARTLGHSAMEPEHLLVGLLREGSGLAATMLEALDARLPVVQTALQPAADPIAAWACSFCGKRRDAVQRLIQGPGWVAPSPGDTGKQPLLICNECVTLCTDIIAKETARTSDPLEELRTARL